MPTIEMIVLAKSKKLGGKCIAGLRTDGGGWVRPVAPSIDGTLFPQHYTLTNGSQAEVLDVVKIDLKEPRQEPHQPENWLISGGRWRLIARPASPEHQRVLWNHIVLGPTLLGNNSDSVKANRFEEAPADASLALIIPGKIEWSIRKYSGDKRQTRAVFKLKGVKYDLAITDPDWEENLSDQPEGNHPAESTKRFLLTVSLGEPYRGYCYKLVASVLTIE